MVKARSYRKKATKSRYRRKTHRRVRKRRRSSNKSRRRKRIRGSGGVFGKPANAQPQNQDPRLAAYLKRKSGRSDPKPMVPHREIVKWANKERAQKRWDAEQSRKHREFEARLAWNKKNPVRMGVGPGMMPSRWPAGLYDRHGVRQRQKRRPDYLRKERRPKKPRKPAEIPIPGFNSGRSRGPRKGWGRGR